MIELSLYDPIHMTATPQQLQQKLLGMVAAAPDILDDEEDQPLSALDTEDLRDNSDSDSESPDDGIPAEQVDLEKMSTNDKHKRRLKLARLKKKAEEKGMRWAQILTSVRSIVPAVRQSIGGPLPTAGDQQRATQNKEREFHADNSL